MERKGRKQSCPEIQFEEMTEFETNEKSHLVQPDVKRQGIATYKQQSFRLEAVCFLSLMVAFTGSIDFSYIYYCEHWQRVQLILTCYLLSLKTFFY